MGETSTIATGDAFAEDAGPLKIRYRSLGDDELRYIATHTELTETARAVLEHELAARGITDLDDYKRQLSEEAAAAERHWPERLWRHLSGKPDSPLAKPHRLEALVTLLLGGMYIAPPASGENRTTSDTMSPVLFVMVLYCVLVAGAQLLGLATAFAKYGIFPLAFRLFSYLGPALLMVGGILLFKRSSAALVLIALHLVWLVARNPVTAYVLEQPEGIGIRGCMFVAVLLVPALILGYGIVLRRKGVLR